MIVSCPHQCKLHRSLIGILLRVKGNECVSCLNGDQAAARLICCMGSHKVAPTLMNV